MNILDYIDLKRDEYEKLESENQLLLLNNKNIIEKLSAQLIQFTEEEDPNQFFLPEAVEIDKVEQEKLQKRIDDLKEENKILEENIEKFRLELTTIDELELPEPTVKNDNTSFISDNSELKSQLEFCMKIAELDGHRCQLELRNILEKMENVSRETFSEETAE